MFFAFMPLWIIFNFCFSYGVRPLRHRNDTVYRRFRVEECTREQTENIISTAHVLRIKLGWTITAALNEDGHEVNDQAFSQLFQTQLPSIRRTVASRYYAVLNELSRPGAGAVNIVCDNLEDLCGTRSGDADPYARRWFPPLSSGSSSTHERDPPLITLVR